MEKIILVVKGHDFKVEFCALTALTAWIAQTLPSMLMALQLWAASSMQWV
jgi:hypothetical protein